jgi:hypothetical protein
LPIAIENLPFLYGGLSHDLPGWVQGPGNQRMRAGNARSNRKSTFGGKMFGKGQSDQNNEITI